MVATTLLLASTLFQFHCIIIKQAFDFILIVCLKCLKLQFIFLMGYKKRGL